MCREVTEGTRYACQHYVVTFYAALWDCNKAKCTKSQRHPTGCRATSCVQEFGPGVEKVTEVSEKPCPRCR